eukprot:1379502-Pleurochrysis_carterae.AAC.1
MVAADSAVPHAAAPCVDGLLGSDQDATRKRNGSVRDWIIDCHFRRHAAPAEGMAKAVAIRVTPRHGRAIARHSDGRVRGRVELEQGRRQLVLVLLQVLEADLGRASVVRARCPFASEEAAVRAVGARLRAGDVGEP